MHEAVVSEIEETRARRGEMREEEESLPDYAGTPPPENARREHDLEARLIRLEDAMCSRTPGVPGEKAARQTDPTRSPKLLEDPEER